MAREQAARLGLKLSSDACLDVRMTHTCSMSGKGASSPFGIETVQIGFRTLVLLRCCSGKGASSPFGIETQIRIQVARDKQPLGLNYLQVLIVAREQAARLGLKHIDESL